MKKQQYSKGPWEQRQLFEKPFDVKSEAGHKWKSNSIDIHNNDNRVICEVRYATDSPEMGWGHNETLTKWKANAKLIEQAPAMLEALELIASNSNDHAIIRIATKAIKEAT